MPRFLSNEREEGYHNLVDRFEGLDLDRFLVEVHCRSLLTRISGILYLLSLKLEIVLVSQTLLISLSLTFKRLSVREANWKKSRTLSWPRLDIFDWLRRCLGCFAISLVWKKEETACAIQDSSEGLTTRRWTSELGRNSKELIWNPRDSRNEIIISADR